MISYLGCEISLYAVLVRLQEQNFNFQKIIVLGFNFNVSNILNLLNMACTVSVLIRAYNIDICIFILSLYCINSEIMLKLNKIIIINFFVSFYMLLQFFARRPLYASSLCAFM